MRLRIVHRHRKNSCRDAVPMARMRPFSAWAVPVAGAPMAKGNQSQIRRPPAANQCVRKSIRRTYGVHRCVTTRMEINRIAECADGPISGSSITTCWKCSTANTADNIPAMCRPSIRQFWNGNSRNWMWIMTVNCRRSSAKSCDVLCEKYVGGDAEVCPSRDWSSIYLPFSGDQTKTLRSSIWQTIVLRYRQGWAAVASGMDKLFQQWKTESWVFLECTPTKLAPNSLCSLFETELFGQGAGFMGNNNFEDDYEDSVDEYEDEDDNAGSNSDLANRRIDFGRRQKPFLTPVTPYPPVYCEFRSFQLYDLK